jgi:formylglycine-generating enzyme required for sulfatase activity
MGRLQLTRTHEQPPMNKEHHAFARLAALAVLGALAFLPAGCERKASDDAGRSATASAPPPAPGTPPSGGGDNARAPGVAAPGQSATDSKAEMVQIPGGRFVMGDKDQADARPHEVTVSAFYMDKHLVTQDRYQAAMGGNPSRWKAAANPVEQVRWSDAVKYCNKRSQSEGLQPCYDLRAWTCNFDANGYRLPTEAEWEYACRAGSTSAYFFGDNPSKLGDYAWYDKNSGGHPRPVGQKQPNRWGLFDICGNVWEWCNDFYKVDYYSEAPPQDPKGPKEGDNKVLRGGAWRFSDESCRSGYRYNENPGYADVCFGYDIYGFRCVRRAANR